MNRILSILVLVLLAKAPSWAQEIPFNIYFLGDQPPNASFLPRGGGVLNGDIFSAVVYLDDIRPGSGRLLRFNPFEVISEMQIIFAAYSSEMGSGTAYSIEQSLQLSGSEIESLLAGEWRAEVMFGQETYIAQFAVVPEPSAAALLMLGATLVMHRRRLHVLRRT